MKKIRLVAEGPFLDVQIDLGHKEILFAYIGKVSGKIVVSKWTKRNGHVDLTKEYQ